MGLGCQILLGFGGVLVFQRRAQRAFGSMYIHCESRRMRPISSEMAAPRRPKLTGCIKGMSENGLAKEFFRYTNVLRNTSLQSPEC